MQKFNMSALLNAESKKEKAKKNNCPRTGYIIQSIYIGNLVPDPKNFYSIGDVEELKDSILMYGLQQPIVVRQNDDGMFTVISGHRRLEALKKLVEEGFEGFEDVPCKIETPLDEVREELKLILANATSRELTDYEKTHQAARLRELLLILKNSGAKLPGRMRELVADTMNVSPTQVARMEAIEKNLLPKFMEEFKDKKINISVAYELSGLPNIKQEAAYMAYKDKGSFSISDVKSHKAEKPVDKPKSEPIPTRTYKPVEEITQEPIKEANKTQEGIKPVPEEEKEPVQERQSLKIYVCSPYGGLDENYLKACGYCTRVAAEGHIPFASHVMLHNILEEPEGREKGITAGLEMIRIVDELWVFGEEITDGMNREIEEAKRLGIKIVYCMEEVS